MNVGQHCKRDVVSVMPNTALTDAANLMQQRSVGFLVVAEERGGQRFPVGVLTDRDIVVRVIGSSVDPKDLLVKDVMSPNPILAHEHDDFLELVRGMRTAGIRRIPVVDHTGALRGIFALDDALEIVVEILDHLRMAVSNEQRFERRQRQLGGVSNER
jgi:CBS domain-containing protein